MTLVSVRSHAFRVSVITVRSFRLFLVSGCYRDVGPAVATKKRITVPISSIVGSSTVAPPGSVRSVATILIRKDSARDRGSRRCGRCHRLVVISYGLFVASSFIR